MLTFFACGNRVRQTESFKFDDQLEIEQADSDTTSASVLNDKNVVEENNQSSVYSSSSSSSHSHKSNHYDNMRGFDPASEDDMEDNGMSRYMENNDEEGWD
jgi:hypothetical protein